MGDGREAIVNWLAPTCRTRNARRQGGCAGRRLCLSFEDITQQLLDQRRAAWSDVARRIAHEIKNPLTPIQLAAERLQRRFGDKIEGDSATFKKLTDTVIRQVHDMRRMVGEFSSFARMPKPTFGSRISAISCAKRYSCSRLPSPISSLQ
ncbi:histidine kinase dimerization/phospho-acceptor domain-containing protein [Sphingopyxis sp.]|uniref:sensor histidine kinase n=1 Tax=Sphingopyxis sp. TaxID=1908224 RepID=UPI0025D1C576|nr:histidine kinase dimerization/phospho-acceptor domain-containing protein [Sphingopyxis sp.]